MSGPKVLIMGAGATRGGFENARLPPPVDTDFFNIANQIEGPGIISKYPKIIIKPNYISDDEGLPSNHAPGGKPDIECNEENKYILVEATLRTGTQQNIYEMPSILRHLQEKVAINEKSFSIFVAPRIHQDSLVFSEFSRYSKGVTIMPLSIKDLLSALGKEPLFYAIETPEKLC